jgi:Enoyl-(Acyl carrier protein) reductase
VEFGSLIAAVGKQLLQERIHPEQSGKKQDTAVAILDIGGLNDGVEQQTQRIYKKVALLAFDLLPRIKAMRIDTGPPFSALLTLWLSMIAAVAPGFVRTDMTQGGRGAADWQGTEERLAARAMMGRIGEPEDIANAVVFLLSDDAGYMTGQSVAANGGAIMIP